ncbi:hypothetical protein RFI_31478, partial [Reticulomyxa filosa]
YPTLQWTNEDDNTEKKIDNTVATAMVAESEHASGERHTIEPQLSIDDNDTILAVSSVDQKILSTDLQRIKLMESSRQSMLLSQSDKALHSSTAEMTKLGPNPAPLSSQISSIPDTLVVPSITTTTTTTNAQPLSLQKQGTVDDPCLPSAIDATNKTDIQDELPSKKPLHVRNTALNLELTSKQLNLPQLPKDLTRTHTMLEDDIVTCIRMICRKFVGNGIFFALFCFVLFCFPKILIALSANFII